MEKYLKAITAFITSAIGSYTLSNQSGNGVTENEWWWILGAVVFSTVSVLGVPNINYPSRPLRRSRTKD